LDKYGDSLLNLNKGTVYLIGYELLELIAN
jgi:hypothetical protein